MEAQLVYIPEDRRIALAEGQDLPAVSTGAALFGDISGFTPLAEILTQEFGYHKGAEELTRYLNSVFDTIIRALHLYHGSVIGFSGDAITCWLEGDNGLHAAACALEMQRRMQQFACIALPSGKTISLAMKVAVACGPVRRFLVGDPLVQLIDVLAGRTLDYLAETEHMAGRGEVVLHPTAAEPIRDLLYVAEWRTSKQTGQQFAIVSDLKVPVAPNPWPPFRADKLSSVQVRPWLLTPVHQRLSIGMGHFLAELRPAVAVFAQFLGIDFETDPQAGEKLDCFIQGVIRILAKYDGSLIQLTIGDKGSYLYSAFGAPIAHEDDAVRAVSTAQEIIELQTNCEFISEIHIGISSGRMRTGDYGGELRRTYGVLGDEVNVAARLMQAAAPGQILCTPRILKSTAGFFNWEGPQSIKLKGKQAPLDVFALQGTQEKPRFRYPESEYTLPMVGREHELQEIEGVLMAVSQGNGRVVTITGEAGVGKSRFVAEMIGLSQRNNFAIHDGACQSFGTCINYLVWQNIYRGLFGLDPSWTLKKQVQMLKRQLQKADSILVERMPLLGNVLGLAIPDNDLTRSMDVKTRKASLEALLVDFLRSKASKNPVLLVLDDCQWIDALSRDLVIEVGKAISDLPVMITLVYRPFESERLEQELEKGVRSVHTIHLSELPQTSIEELILLKVTNLFGSDVSPSRELKEAITLQSEGNPFYVEELLNYLHDCGVDPQNPVDFKKLTLPDTLGSLILSRIDQLSEHQKITIKVASVIGREFRSAWLSGYYEELGALPQISNDLYRLSQIELLSLHKISPEIIYLFKHILIQEAAYESLPFATRATLHDQFGNFIENKYRDALGPYLNLLAYHFDHSENEPKKREYLVKAGEASQLSYANEAAISYFQRALPMLSGREEVMIRKKLGQVMELVGRWSEAETIYQQAIEQADQLNEPRDVADCQTAMGELQRKRGHYPEASAWHDKTLAIYRDLADDEGISHALHYKGTAAAHQGQYEQAQNLYTQSLEICKRLNDRARIASLLSNMGIVERFQGNYPQARQLHEQALTIRRELGDKWAIGVSLNNLGNVAIDQKSFEEARLLQEEGLAIRRLVGDRWAIANALNNLGNLAREQEDYKTAASLYHASMLINKDLQGPWALSYLLEDIGCLCALADQPEPALRLVGAASKQRDAIGAPLSPAEKKKLDCVLDRVRENMSEDQWKKIYEKGRNMSMEQVIDFALDLIGIDVNKF